MQHLSEDIKVRFFKLLNEEEEIGEFEQWIYATVALEDSLGEDYLDLISLDFSRRGSQYELSKIIERHIDCGEFETWKLRKLLKSLIDREGDLRLTLCEFYELYCRGLYFLESLGIEYGLGLISPSSYSSNPWQDLDLSEKDRFLNCILPGAMDEAQKILSWLDEGKIVITEGKDDMGHCLYLDKRSEKEKETSLKDTGITLNKPKLKFWQKFFKH
jgi:hypothetical protein